jgi:uncharacterized membrane protein
MKRNSEYKDMALRSLEGNWTKAVVASLIAFLILEIVGSSPSMLVDPVPGMVWQGVITILLLPLAWGYRVFFLRMVREENTDYERLFDGFSQYVRITLAELLKGIYVLLWMLLLIIPGIVKDYSYAMTEFILKDHPEISGEEAICQSMKMMQGHKMQLFLLDLSMIGWFILSCLTLGIGFLFLVPYNYSAHAHFYEDLKEQYNDINPF